MSLCNIASDPGPEYFEEGCMKVTNASNVLYSYVNFRLSGPIKLLEYDFILPYLRTLCMQGEEHILVAEAVLAQSSLRRVYHHEFEPSVHPF